MEAIVYCRWSTQHQEEGDSFERQTRLAQHIAAQNGWVIVETHIESGKSAYHGLNRSKSGKLRQIEDRAAAGELRGKVLIVEAMDRLSRQEPMASLTLLNTLCDNGLTICESSTGFMWDKTRIQEHWTNLIVALARAGEAYDSSRIKARRVKSAWQATQASGRMKNGKADKRLCPAWMEVVDGEYTVIEQRAEIIRQMVQMSLTGYGLRPIATWANEQRELTGWPKAPWQIRTVHNLFKDRRLVGQYQPFERGEGSERNPVGEPIDLYPAIVSHTDFFNISKAMAARKATGGPRKKYVNVLSGLCRCSCGSSLNLRTQKRQQPQLTCASFNRGSGCKINTTYRYTSLLDGILSGLLSHAIPNKVSEDNSDAIAGKRAELIAKEKRADEIADRLIEADDPIMERALVRFREQIAALRDELRELEQTAKVELPSMEEVIQEVNDLKTSLHDDVESRMKINQMLRSVIERIEMDEETRGCHVVMKGENIVFSFDKAGNSLGATVLQTEIIGPDGERNWKPD